MRPSPPVVRHPTLASVSAALRRRARPAGTFDARRYFRGESGLRFYNTGMPCVQALARDIYRANRDKWTVHDAMRFSRRTRI